MVIFIELNFYFIFVSIATHHQNQQQQQQQQVTEKREYKYQTQNYNYNQQPGQQQFVTGSQQNMIEGGPAQNIPIQHQQQSMWIPCCYFFIPPPLGIGGIKLYPCRYEPHLVSVQ